jgi:putative spermidine/putrescine transport system permease protein
MIRSKTPQTLTEKTAWIGLWIVSVLVLIYLVAPLLTIIPLSFSSDSFLHYPIPGLSFRWYLEFFESDDWALAFRNTILIGTAVTLLSTCLGTSAALGLTRKAFPFKKIAVGFIIAPMIVPVIILAVGSYFLFAPLGLANSFLGIIIAHTTLAVPFVVVTVSSTLSGFDDTLIRAGASLGANPFRVFMKVVLPIVLPGVVSGALLAFATSLDEVVMILFLAGPEQTTIPRQMFNGLKYFLGPTITAAATILTLFSILLLAIAAVLRRATMRLSKAQAGQETP